MDQQQLRDYLDQLNLQIEELHAPDSDKQRLANLIEDIERQLAEPALQNQTHTMVEDVEALISSFERDHPTVSGILHNIMVTLSSMGV